MQMGEVRAVPLNESGNAPRVFIHDLDRLDSYGDGVYCFVGTSPIIIDGNREQQVIIYIETNWRVIGKGIMLAAMHVVELSLLRDALANIKKVCSRLTLH